MQGQFSIGRFGAFFVSFVGIACAVRAVGLLGDGAEMAAVLWLTASGAWLCLACLVRKI